MYCETYVVARAGWASLESVGQAFRKGRLKSPPGISQVGFLLPQGNFSSSLKAFIH